MSLLWFPPWVSPASGIRQQGTAVSPTPELLVCLMPDNSCQQKKALSAGRIWNYSDIHKQMGAILPCKVNSSQQPECYRCLNSVMTESRGKLARSLVVPGNKSQPLWNSLGAVSEHHMKCSIPARPPWDSRAEGSAQHSVQVFHFFNILSTTLVSLSCHFCSGSVLLLHLLPTSRLAWSAAKDYSFSHCLHHPPQAPGHQGESSNQRAGLHPWGALRCSSKFSGEELHTPFK